MEYQPKTQISQEKTEEIEAKYNAALKLIEASDADRDIKDRIRELVESWKRVRLSGQDNIIAGFSMTRSDIRESFVHRINGGNLELLNAVEELFD